MSWDWDWQLDTLNLIDVASAIVLEDEGGGSWVESAVRIPNRDGVLLDDLATRGAMLLPIRMVLRYGDAAGAVTHANGAPGHVKENLSEIKRRFATPGLRTLRRTDPDAGRQRALVKSLTDPIPGGYRERFAYRWMLTCPSGSWQDDTESSAAAGSVVTSGDVRIHDPIIEMGAGTLTHTAADGTVSTITATGTVTIDVGAGTISPSRDLVTFSQPWWLRMDPDGAQSFTGTATIKWRNRWA